MAVYRFGKKTSDLNVQSDFNVTNTSDDRYIRNRPDSTLKISLDGVEQSKSYNPNTGSETINIDLGPTITNQNNRVDEIITNLDVASVGGDGKYISTISEEDGIIHATAVSTASTFSSSGTTAINGKGVNEALKTLDGNVTGTPGKGKTLTSFSETDGKVTAKFEDILITSDQVSGLKETIESLAARTTVSSPTININITTVAKDEVFYIDTADKVINVSAASIMGVKLTFVANKAVTIKYPNFSNGTIVTKSMEAGTVFLLFSCGNGYTPNLYGLVLDINPSTINKGQIYIKTN